MKYFFTVKLPSMFPRVVMLKTLRSHYFPGRMSTLSYKKLSNSGSVKSDVLKRHLVEHLCKAGGFHVKVTGEWSLMVMGWILDSEIFGIIELLTKNKSICE